MTLRSHLNNTQRIRNISVIAHVDHGKSTLSDSLVAAGGLISNASSGNARWLDTGKLEKEKGITIKSTGVTLLFERPGREAMVVNLIDSPGHVDFSSEVTAALRVTDGALVVVDCVEGVCVQTETVLRQALAEKIKPVLVINKIDRCINELQLEPEEAYHVFRRAIESFNVIVATYQDSDLGDVQVDPLKGTVAFCAGLLGTGFTLTQFARMYSSKWGMPESKVMQRLWGDNFFDEETRKWSSSSTSPSGKVRPRGFCKFVLEPIYRMFRAALDNDHAKLQHMMEALNTTPGEGWAELRDKKLLKATLQQSLPAAEALLDMVELHLPSPVQAQLYRFKSLYAGPLDDIYAQGIKNCDPEGPLMVYISKLVPADSSRFYAFGRVFSGTLKAGQRVRIAYKGREGEGYQVHKKSAQRTVIMLGRHVEAVESVPAGCTCGTVGLDQFILKTCTLSDAEADDAACFHDMSYSVSPVVQVAVQPVHSQDLPKMVEGLRRLCKADPLLQYWSTEAGEHIVAGAGELHLEVALEELRTEYAKVPIRDSLPIVAYRESMLSASSTVCMTKSANKLNRFHVTAQPLGEELAVLAETQRLGEMDAKERAQVLVSHGWDPLHAKRITAWGPEEGTGTNVIVDATHGQQHMREVEDSVRVAFTSATTAGPLCGEPMRGVHVSIVDATLHQDGSHRGPRQIVPAVQRAAHAAVLSGGPCLMEPVYRVEIQCPEESISAVYSTLTQRRGSVENEEHKPGTTLYVVQGFLPVRESFGFASALRAQTGGKAFPQCVFSHWQVLPGDVYSQGSLAHSVVMDIRKRKGIDGQVPTAEQLVDRL